MVDAAALALALVAGAVAAVNPCGFALLPAYIMLAVTGDARGAAITVRGVALVRAARFTAGMTLGFVLVFTTFALIIAPVAAGVQRYLPAITVALGVALVGAGAWLLAGRELPTLPRIAVPGRRGGAPGTGFASQVSYGVTFALASLSCTVAPFLAVATRALQEGPLAVVITLGAYAVGMGAVVGALALSAALARAQLAEVLRRWAPVMHRVAGALVLLAGLYVAWYGIFEIRVLEGGAGSDPVIRGASAVQSAMSRWIGGQAPGLIAGVALGIGSVAAAVGWATRRRGRQRGKDLT